MTREEAIRFANYAQCMAKLQDVKEFYALAEAALREQEERRWIPVTERLPEDSTYVLARLSGGAIYQALCLTKGSKQWYSANHERFVNKDTVTHWMPLPKPPIGE